MRDVSEELRAVVRDMGPRLRAVSEMESQQTRGPEKWSRREILGHLIDSAVNNTHRFVRAQRENPLRFPGYEQEHWVTVQGYKDRRWNELIGLWSALNEHVAEAISRIPERARANECVIGGAEPVTLDFVARDYVTHLRHHLEQVLEPVARASTVT